MRDDNQWEECEAGVVSGMAKRLRSRRRFKQLGSAIAAGSLFVLLLVMGYSVIDRGEPPARARLNCRETVQLLAKYHAQSLDEAMAHDVREHLAGCPMCREHYEDLYPSEVRTDSIARSRLVATIARFPH